MKLTRHWLITTLLLLCLSFGQKLVAAQEKPLIAVVAKNFQGSYSNLAKSLSLSKLNQNYQFKNINLADWKDNPADADFIVSLGFDALQQLNQTESKQPILAALITSNQWHQLHRQEALGENISGIFYDPDNLRQLMLGKMLLPQATKAGILIAPQNNNDETLEHWDAEKSNLALEIVEVSDSAQVIEKFSNLADKTDFQLALPDRKIYNRLTIPKVFLTTYRQNKPVIGYSLGMVKAGAIATTYTDSQMLLEDLVETIELQFSGEQQAFHRHSNNFSIKYNQEVAKALSIRTVTLEQLKAKLAEQHSSDHQPHEQTAPEKTVLEQEPSQNN